MATLFDENRFEEAIDSKIVKMINAKAVSSKSYNARVTRKDSSGTWWVRIPGNDFDTPVLVNKADMSVGDIVTVIIDTEKHVTIVDGNLTSPPSSTYNSQLYVDEIVGEKLRVTYADISVLKADYAQIQYAMIEDADITNARIQNLIYETTRQAEQIEANKAYIDDLEANNITAQTLSADHATIETLDATYATVENLEAAEGRIGTLESDNVTVNNKITAAEGRIGTLESDNVTVNNKITAAEGRIGTLESDNVTVNNKITAAEGDIATLKSNKADISYLESDYIKADVIEANYAQANLANVNNAWIENGTIKDAAIVDAQILGVSANKLTAGTIDASKINVANLRAKNLVVEKLNGQPVLGGYELVNSNMSGYSSKNPASEGWYEYSNGEWTASTDTAVVESKVYYKDADQVELYDQTYIDGLEDTLNQRIDGAVETFTGSVVPTMINYPVSDWTSSQYASHVGDIYYVVNQSSDENGYCYRFAYDNTTHSYQWVLIKDSDVTKALSDISDLQAFESETSSWIDETDEGLRTIRTNHTALSGVVDKTVKSSVQLWFTKANTTAPSAPTSKVETNNVSTANAWNLAVPTYNASYPNYYYCWQYQYADNTYGWSAVVRDVAMGETQSTARSAQTTADANIKSSVMLWFSKSNATAPSKPTSQITSTGTGGNAWTTVVPTWNASYPYYFYCYQQQKGDGTWQWTDVVYDRATSEAQQKASAALPASTFTNFQQTTFKELVDEVDEQSSTISTLSSRVDQKADGSTVTTLSNTVNTVKQTADTNKTSITNLTTTTQTLRNDLDNLEVGGRNLLRWTSKPESTWTNWNSDPASSTGWGRWSTAWTVTDTDEGIKGTSNNTNPSGFAIPLVSNNAVVGGEEYTLSFDYRTNRTTIGDIYLLCSSGGNVLVHSNAVTASTTDWKHYEQVIKWPSTSGKTTRALLVPYFGTVDDWFEIRDRSMKLEKGNKATDWSPAPEDTEASITEIRTTTTNKFNEVEQTLDGIETSIGVIQNDLTSKADGTTVSTLTTKVNNISDTVDGHTQRITATETVANGVRTDFDNMEVGGRNLLKGRTENNTWPVNGLTVEYDAETYMFHVYGTNTKTDSAYSAGSYTSTIVEELIPGEYYTLTMYSDDYESIKDQVYVQCNYYRTSGTQNGMWGIDHRDGHYPSITEKCPTDYDYHDAFFNVFIGIRPTARAIDTTFRLKFEKGNVSTDWSPAPEDVRVSVNSIKTDYAEFKQTVNQFQSTIGSTYATKTIGNENLTPMFSSHNADGTYPDGNADGYWQPTTDKQYNRSAFSALDDGWIHVSVSGTTQHEFAPARVEDLKAGDQVTILVEWRNVSYTGNGAFHYFRDYTSANVQLGISGVNYGSSLATDMNSEEGKSWNLVTVTSVTGTAAWNALANFTFLAKDGSSSWTGDVRISFYRGDYQGPYKPYVGSKLYSSKSEIKQTADSINLEVSKKVGANEIISKINQSPEEVTIDADRIKINGTTIYSSNGTNTTLDNYLGSNYVSGQDVTTATDFNTFTSSGVYYIKNGSCANAPTTNWGKLDVSVSGKTVQLFYPDALSYYYYRAKSGSTWSAWTKVDGVGAAATVQTNLDNLEVGGSNLLKGSMTLAVSETGKCGWMVNSQTPEIVTKDGYRCLHASASLGTTWTPSIRTRNRVLLEWGQEYRYSGYIMYDKAIKTASSAPLHYHVGSVENLDEFNLSINSKGGGVSVTQIEPGANVTVPANTWQRYVYKIETVASAPNASYPYPTIAPFIYGSVRTVSETATVNMWARDMQIEKGSKVTSWRAASEDAESYADAAIETIPLHHNLVTNYSYTASQLAGYAEEGHITWWEITESTTENVRVGDTVSLKITNSTTGKDAYLNGEVTQVNSSTRITVKAHGLSDTGASILAENATAVVNVYPTAIDFVKGTATLAVSLCVGGAAKTPTSYKWTKGTDYTTSLGTGSTLAVTDLDVVYNCECTWS